MGVNVTWLTNIVYNTVNPPYVPEKNIVSCFYVSDVLIEQSKQSVNSGKLLH